MLQFLHRRKRIGMKSRLISLIALLSFGIAPQAMAQVLTPEDDGIIPDPPNFITTIA